MKRIYGFVILTFATVHSAQTGDFTIRGGNFLRWARGNAYLQGSNLEVQQNWFENVTDLSLSYKDLQMGLRHYLLRPSEFGEEQGGIEAIDFKYLEYRYNNMILTAGNYYATIGRGLALNLYQDYALNFDSNLEGFKAEFNADKVNFLAFQGRSYPSSSPEGSRVRENDLEGAMLELLPYDWASIAGYYLYVPEESYPETRMPGGFTNISAGPLTLYAESVLQYVQDGSADPYYGNYLAVDFTASGFGVIVDYKDYNFKKFGTYTSGGITTSEPLAYQNPPIVQLELTTKLLSTHPHVPLFDDEVGFQIEAVWQPIDPLTITTNFSRSSLHRGKSLIPSLHEEDAPFWQLFIDNEYDFPGGHWVRFDLGINEEVKVTGAEAQKVSYFWQRKQAVALEGTYYLNARNSITIHQETMHLQDLKMDETFWEYFSSLTFSRSPWGGVSLIFEMTDDPDAGSRSRWLGSEITLNFMKQHNLLLFVGQDRGGLKCTSGRCRYVDPFEGVKLTLQSTF